MTVKLGIKQSPNSKEQLEKLYPSYGTAKSACFDLRADLEGRTFTIRKPTGTKEEVTFKKGDKLELGSFDRMLIPTGIIFEIPEDYRLEIVPRSGRTWKDALVVMNSPARIDEDYTLETFVIIQNQSFEIKTIQHGEKIAQAEINPVTRVDLPVESEIRNAGFGSTGN